MNKYNLKGVLEGLLFSTGHEGITIKQISDVLGVNQENVSELINELALDYKQEGRGIRLSECQGSYYLTTKPEHNVYFKQLLNTSVQTKLSQAALETLSIISDNQPLPRVEIEN